jgi:hypothetical protein
MVSVLAVWVVMPVVPEVQLAMSVTWVVTVTMVAVLAKVALARGIAVVVISAVVDVESVDRILLPVGDLGDLGVMVIDGFPGRW